MSLNILTEQAGLSTWNQVTIFFPPRSAISLEKTNKQISKQKVSKKKEESGEGILMLEMLILWRWTVSPKSMPSYHLQRIKSPVSKTQTAVKKVKS